MKVEKHASRHSITAPPLGFVFQEVRVGRALQNKGTDEYRDANSGSA